MTAQKVRGFTLIELLIVITIIGVLSAIGLLVYATVLKNARDSKRQSDLKFIQSSLEEYHADWHVYPESLTALSTGTKIYLTTIPTEPVAGRSNYKYECVTGCSSYCLSASLESLAGNKTEGACLNPSGYNFTVTRP